MLPHIYILLYYTLLYFDVKNKNNNKQLFLVSFCLSFVRFSFLNLSLFPFLYLFCLLYVAKVAVRGWRGGGVGHAA